MEIDSVKEDVKRLTAMAASGAHNEDAIVYAVYDLVRRSHVTAKMLLLEGRFPELQRCLDLTRAALAAALRRVGLFAVAPPHGSPEAARGPGRRTSPRGTGMEQQQTGALPAAMADRHHPPGGFRISEEDVFLLASLQTRTAQLQRQLEEARRTRPGRDTNYYLRRLLDWGQAEDASLTAHEDGSEGARLGWAFGKEGQDIAHRAPTVTPPERGVSIGRRTKLNRWKIVHELPPLVTNANAFLDTAAKPAAPADQRPAITMEAGGTSQTARLGSPLSEELPMAAAEEAEEPLATSPFATSAAASTWADGSLRRAAASTTSHELISLLTNTHRTDTPQNTAATVPTVVTFALAAGDGQSPPVESLPGHAATLPALSPWRQSPVEPEGDDDEESEESEEEEGDGAWQSLASSVRATGRVLHFYASPSAPELVVGHDDARGAGARPMLPPPSIPHRRHRGSLTAPWQPPQPPREDASRRGPTGEAVRNVPQQLARRSRARVPLAQQIAAGKARHRKRPDRPRTSLETSVSSFPHSTPQTHTAAWAQGGNGREVIGAEGSPVGSWAGAGLGGGDEVARDPLRRSALAVQSAEEVLRSLDASATQTKATTQRSGDDGAAPTSEGAPWTSHPFTQPEAAAASSFPTTSSTPLLSLVPVLPVVASTKAAPMPSRPIPKPSKGCMASTPCLPPVRGVPESSDSTTTTSATCSSSSMDGWPTQSDGKGNLGAHLGTPRSALLSTAAPSHGTAAAPTAAGPETTGHMLSPPRPPLPPSFSLPFSPHRDGAPASHVPSPPSMMSTRSTTIDAAWRPFLPLPPPTFAPPPHRSSSTAAAASGSHGGSNLPAAGAQASTNSTSTTAPSPASPTHATALVEKESLLAFQERDRPTLSQKSRNSLHRLCSRYERETQRAREEVAALRAKAAAQHSALFPRRSRTTPLLEDTQEWKRRGGRTHADRSSPRTVRTNGSGSVDVSRSPSTGRSGPISHVTSASGGSGSDDETGKATTATSFRWLTAAAAAEGWRTGPQRSVPESVLSLEGQSSQLLGPLTASSTANAAATGVDSVDGVEGGPQRSHRAAAGSPTLALRGAAVRDASMGSTPDGDGAAKVTVNTDGGSSSSDATVNNRTAAAHLVTDIEEVTRGDRALLLVSSTPPTSLDSAGEQLTCPYGSHADEDALLLTLGDEGEVPSGVEGIHQDSPSALPSRRLPSFFACARGVASTGGRSMTPLAEVEARLEHLAAKVDGSASPDPVHALVLTHYQKQKEAHDAATANPFLFKCRDQDGERDLSPSTMVTDAADGNVASYPGGIPFPNTHLHAASTIRERVGNGEAVVAAAAAALRTARVAAAPAVANWRRDASPNDTDPADDGLPRFPLLTQCLAAVRLQRWWRGCAARAFTAARQAALQREREAEAVADKAAVCIQRHVRGATARAVFRTRVEARDAAEGRRIAQEGVYIARPLMSERHRWHLQDSVGMSEPTEPSMAAVAEWPQVGISFSHTYTISFASHAPTEAAHPRDGLFTAARYPHGSGSSTGISGNAIASSPSRGDEQRVEARSPEQHGNAEAGKGTEKGSISLDGDDTITTITSSTGTHPGGSASAEGVRSTEEEVSPLPAKKDEVTCQASLTDSAKESIPSAHVHEEENNKEEDGEESALSLKSTASQTARARQEADSRDPQSVVPLPTQGLSAAHAVPSEDRAMFSLGGSVTSATAAADASGGTPLSRETQHAKQAQSPPPLRFSCLEDPRPSPRAAPVEGAVAPAPVQSSPSPDDAPLLQLSPPLVLNIDTCGDAGVTTTSQQEGSSAGRAAHSAMSGDASATCVPQEAGWGVLAALRASCAARVIQRAFRASRRRTGSTTLEDVRLLLHLVTGQGPRDALMRRYYASSSSTNNTEATTAVTDSEAHPHITRSGALGSQEQRDSSPTAAQLLDRVDSALRTGCAPVSKEAVLADFMTRNAERRAKGNYLTLWSRAPASERSPQLSDAAPSSRAGQRTRTLPAAPPLDESVMQQLARRRSSGMGLVVDAHLLPVLVARSEDDVTLRTPTLPPFARRSLPPVSCSPFTSSPPMRSDTDTRDNEGSLSPPVSPRCAASASAMRGEGSRLPAVLSAPGLREVACPASATAAVATETRERGAAGMSPSPVSAAPAPLLPTARYGARHLPTPPPRHRRRGTTLWAGHVSAESGRAARASVVDTVITTRTYTDESFCISGGHV